MASSSAPIVCGLDFSDGSEASLVRAADLAERLHAPLELLHADPLFRAPAGLGVDPADPDVVLRSRVAAFAEQALGGPDAVKVVGPTAVIVRGEYAADAIVSYAEDIAPQLVVVGTHGRRGVRHLIMGSVAEEVVQRSPCPVLTVPNAATRTAPGPDAPIVIGVDFSESSQRAIDMALRYARLYSAPIELVHVVEALGAVPTFYGDAVALHDLPNVSERAVDRLGALADETDGASAHVCVGRPYVEMVARAQAIDAGLIVLATHGLTGLTHAVLGSVAERTLQRASCPVLTVRAAS